MNRRNTIIGVLVLAVIAVFVLSDGDEPKAPEPEPAAERQAQDRVPTARRPAPGDADWYRRPQEPAPDWSREDAGPPREPVQPWYYGQPQVGARSYPPPQQPAAPPPGYGSAPGYAPSYPPQAERYHFRPLTEQERERMEQSYPAPAYPDPYYSVPEPRQDLPPAYAGRGAPSWPDAGYGTRPDAYAREDYRRGYPDRGYSPERPAGEPRYPAQPYPDWQADGYRFRTPERDPTAGRWQGPDQGFGWWDTDPNRGNAWTLPPADGWDRNPPSYTPPSQRMYPSLPDNPDRRFTYR